MTDKVSVTVRITERQWQILKGSAEIRGKSPAWLAHKLLTYAIESEDARVSSQ